jgi:hypothetical protein
LILFEKAGIVCGKAGIVCGKAGIVCGKAGIVCGKSRYSLWKSDEIFNLVTGERNIVES